MIRRTTDTTFSELDRCPSVHASLDGLHDGSVDIAYHDFSLGGFRIILNRAQAKELLLRLQRQLYSAEWFSSALESTEPESTEPSSCPLQNASTWTGARCFRPDCRNPNCYGG